MMGLNTKEWKIVLNVTSVIQMMTYNIFFVFYTKAHEF